MPGVRWHDRRKRQHLPALRRYSQPHFGRRGRVRRNPSDHGFVCSLTTLLVSSTSQDITSDDETARAATLGKYAIAAPAQHLRGHVTGRLQFRRRQQRNSVGALGQLLEFTPERRAAAYLRALHVTTLRRALV
jgi:hypothetical protein